MRFVCVCVDIYMHVSFFCSSKWINIWKNKKKKKEKKEQNNTFVGYGSVEEEEEKKLKEIQVKFNIPNSLVSRSSSNIHSFRLLGNLPTLTKFNDLINETVSL